MDKNTDIQKVIKDLAEKRVHNEYSEAEFKILTLSGGVFSGLLLNDISVDGRMVGETVGYLVMSITKSVAGTPKTTTFDGEILGADSDGTNWVKKLTVQAQGLLGDKTTTPQLPLLQLERIQNKKKGLKAANKYLLSNTAGLDIWVYPVSIYWDSISSTNKVGVHGLKFGAGGKLVFNANALDPLTCYSSAPTITAGQLFFYSIEHEYIDAAPESVKQVNFFTGEATVAAGTDQPILYTSDLGTLKNPYIEYMALNRTNIGIAEIPSITTTNVLNGNLINKLILPGVPDHIMEKTKQSLNIANYLEDTGIQDTSVILFDYSEDTADGYPAFTKAGVSYQQLKGVADVRTIAAGPSLPFITKVAYDV